MITSMVAVQLSIGEAYCAAARGAKAEIDALLSRIPATRRLGDPSAIALRAMKMAADGDVPGALSLLRRGLQHADHVSAQYLIDLYVPLLLGRAEFDEAEKTLEVVVPGDTVEELKPAIMALRGQVAACRGRDDESRELVRAAIEQCSMLENNFIVARVLSRAAFAAFYREDFAEAQERALEAARLFEALEVHKSAAQVYTILYAIAFEWSGNPEVARFYAQRISMKGRLAGDVAIENYGLVGQLEIAAESGDAKRFASLRGRLLANTLHEQFHERMSFVLCETLSQGWIGRFEVAKPAVVATRQAENRTLPERALCDALLAVISLSTWHVDEARRYARLSLTETAHRAAHEPVYETRRRSIARVLAAAVCVAIGDPSRARRSLTKVFDPDGRFAALMSPNGMSEDDVPPMFRGYARFLNVACEASKRYKPVFGLTNAELAVLRALPEGMTIAGLAASFGKSPKTIEAQVSSIYAKLNVTNRAQAIQRARDLGI